MAYSEADLRLADDHIAQGVRHIRLQRELIARLRKHGLPTTQALQLLAEFEATLQLYRDHRELIAADLAGGAG